MTVPMRRPTFSNEWVDYESTRADETVERLRPATIAVTNKVKLGEPELSKLPNLKFIAIT